MSIQDLEKIWEEFENINEVYPATHSVQARLDLLERVKALMKMIQELEMT